MNESQFLNETICNCDTQFPAYYDDYNFTNCSISLSPFESEYVQGSIYFLYTIVFVASILGNGIVCYIVVATPRMRTVTNYFIANLALGDILITITCVPFTSILQMQQYWPFYDFLCTVIPYLQTLSVFVSTYTLVAISVDRYVAIIWPLKPRLSKKTSAFIILSVWLFATITALPIPIVSTLMQPGPEYSECDRYMCKEDWGDIGEHHAANYSTVLLILQFVAPISVLLFTYTSIGIVIWCHRIPGEAENCRDQRIAKSKRKMIKMMVIVVLVYTICWLPLNIYLLYHYFGIRIHHEAIVFFASHWFAMSHPCYNPLIYCYMNNRFRQGFAQIFGLLPCCPSFCLERAMLNHNGRSRMSTPLTSIGGTDSTILHRNNTCTTYISTRRRTGHSLAGGSIQSRQQSKTKIRFSNLSSANNIHSRSGDGAIPYTNSIPPVQSLSLLRSGGDPSLGIELISADMQITRRSRTPDDTEGLFYTSEDV